MKKKKEAILESKCILEQTESSMVNYGGAYSNFALAEKSGSFLDKKKRHVFIFKINNSIKEFDVNEMIYNKLVDCLEKCLICRHIRRFAD